MLNSQKPISLVIVSIILALLLAACVVNSDLAPANDVPPAAAEADTAAEAEEVVAIAESAADTTAAADELAGEIVISVESNDVQTYQALADAYMEKHPNVNVLVELKSPSLGSEAYLQWVRTQFASEVPRVSLFETVHLRDLAQEGRLVNWATYLQRENPYTGTKWEDSFQEWGLNLARDPNTGEIYTLPYGTTQTFWVYNKRIFAEAGITDVPLQPTWDQFVEWNEKIRDAGYTPISIEATIEQIWGGGNMPWLLRSVADQYHRADLEIIRCQEGDWCFREGIDDQWQYDPTDVHNDDPDKVSINIVRHLQALRDGKLNFDNECTVEMMEQIGRIFQTEHGFVPEGWTGLSDGYPLFLTQEAAMRMTTGAFFTVFPKDIQSLAEGAYGGAGEVNEEAAGAAVEFEYGRFAFPTVEGPCVQAKARANEIVAGSLAIPVKDRAQNDLEVDFVMFWTSPEGMRIYMENKLDPENLQGGIRGPSLIKGVTLPEPWDEYFADNVFVGNYVKPGVPGDAVARGFFRYQETQREWAIMMQEFFEGTRTAEEFAQDYQQLLVDNFDDLLTFLNIELADLDAPEKRPPGWVSAGAR